MKKVSYLFLAIVCVLPVSCMKLVNRDNFRLMHQAQEIVENNPDSALMLLDAVNTIKFGKARH